MTWKDCKRILCVRPDNMGDLLMSAPAISALKETFGCSITLLTSSMAADIAAYIPAIDEVIVWDVPWVKGRDRPSSEALLEMISVLRKKTFDGAVIFTVFSQSPLPTALMLTLAGIPNRIAYCRENPYHLLSHWVVEKEPYTYVRHQVRRDLDLVKSIGAQIKDEKISIRLPVNYEEKVRLKLDAAPVDATKPWLIMHPGVSEKKREYPKDLWVEVGKKIVDELQYQVIVTGSMREKPLADAICEGIGHGAYVMAGALSLEEFIMLIRFSPLLVSVNTGSVHLAAALQTKVIVLYALTNPQHAPWKTVGKLLPYSVPEDLQSRSEVLQFVQRTYFSKRIARVAPQEVFNAAHDLLINKSEPLIEELVLSPPRTIPLRDEQHFIFP